MPDCTITREYERRGIDTVLLENDALRVEILAGKGADITQLVDKRTNTNVLFEAPHDWHAPGDGHGGGPSDRFAFLDHYPGGWQTILPSAGDPATVASASFGAHGESSVVPWDVIRIVDRDTAVGVTLSTTLPRYPLEVERTVELEEAETRLDVVERVTNVGEVPVHYQWLQHVALGAPLVGPETTLDVSVDTGRTDAYQNDTARVPADTAFDWPIVEGVDGETVDLGTCPPKSERAVDGATLTSVDGRYTVSNPDLDLAATVEYDPEQFPWLWYWGSFGGYEHSPFFGREYVLGLEPCTSPVSGLQTAIEDDQADEIEPGDSDAVELSVTLGQPE